MLYLLLEGVPFTLVTQVINPSCNQVKIMETRPMSKSKNWRLVEIIERVK